jgi:hypothetical protein
MKRTIIAAVITATVLGAVVTGTAWAGPTPVTSAVITFDDAAQVVTLQIPTPACPTTEPHCQWKFFLNEPKLSVDVATVYGTSGTLSIPYPKDFCGVIQADAYVGGPPWVAKRGWQHPISDCPTPVTPPAPPTVPPAAPTQVPVVTTPVGTTPASTPLPSQAPVVAATASTLPPSEPATTVAPSVVPVTATPTVTPASSPAELPNTGLSIRPLLITGLTLVLFGLCLMIRRRPGIHSRARNRIS